MPLVCLNNIPIIPLEHIIDLKLHLDKGLYLESLHKNETTRDCL